MLTSFEGLHTHIEVVEGNGEMQPVAARRLEPESRCKQRTRPDKSQDRVVVIEMVAQTDVALLRSFRSPGGRVRRPGRRP